MTGMGENIAVAKLRAFVERIEHVEEDIRELNADKSDIYKELRGDGFDVKAVRAVVAKRKLDDADRQERDAIFELYWAALSGASRVHVHATSEMDRAEEGSFETGNVAAEKGRKASPARPEGVNLNHAGAGESPATITVSVAGIEYDTAHTAPAEGAHTETSAPITNPQADPPPQHADQPEAKAPARVASGTISDDDVPAFLKAARPFRPHCQNPQVCAGVGFKHCYSCTKAANLNEVAA